MPKKIFFLDNVLEKKGFAEKAISQTKKSFRIHQTVPRLNDHQTELPVLFYFTNRAQFKGFQFQMKIK